LVGNRAHHRQERRTLGTHRLSERRSTRAATVMRIASRAF
jgi:hypothetical protein